MKIQRSFITALSAFALIPLTVGCGSVIEDGEVGLRKQWGAVNPQELNTGWHWALFSEILPFSTREIIFTVSDLRPQTANNTIMKDFDVDINYTVDPSAVAELYTRFSKSYHETNREGEIYPMVGFIRRFVNTAVNKSVRKHQALNVNSARSEIEADIMAQLNNVFTEQNLNGKLRINSVTVTGVQLPDNLVASVNRKVAAQAEKEAKITEVETARLESERIRLLGSQSSKIYVDQLRAEAMRIAAQKGNTFWIVPQNFNSIGTLK